MSRVTLLVLAALPLAACVDRPPLQKPAEAVPVTGPSLSADAAGTQRSSVCTAWDAELADLRTSLEADPGNAETQDAVTAYEARIQETCN